MRIRSDDGQRMVLSGVPHGAGWMVFALVLGFCVIAAAVFFVRLLSQHGQWVGAIAMGFGGVIGLALACVGATEVVQRERLTLDRTTGRVTWRRWCVLRPGAVREQAYPIRSCVRVRLSRSTEHRPRASGPTDASEALRAEASVVRADLLIASPRRRIRLDETENGRDRRVTRVAERVAAFLDIELSQGS